MAVNVLKIVDREWELGPLREAEEMERLEDLLQLKGPLRELNEVLCEKIRKGGIDSKDPKLIAHLIKTTMGRISINNPKY